MSAMKHELQLLDQHGVQLKTVVLNPSKKLVYDIASRGCVKDPDVTLYTAKSQRVTLQIDENRQVIAKNNGRGGGVTVNQQALKDGQSRLIESGDVIQIEKRVFKYVVTDPLPVTKDPSSSKPKSVVTGSKDVRPTTPSRKSILTVKPVTCPPKQLPKTALVGSKTPQGRGVTAMPRSFVEQPIANIPQTSTVVSESMPAPTSPRPTPRSLTDTPLSVSRPFALSSSLRKSQKKTTQTPKIPGSSLKQAVVENKDENDDVEVHAFSLEEPQPTATEALESPVSTLSVLSPAIDSVSANEPDLSVDDDIEMTPVESLALPSPKSVSMASPKSVPAVSPKSMFIPVLSPKSVPVVSPKSVPVVSPKSVPVVSPKSVPMSTSKSVSKVSPKAVHLTAVSPKLRSKHDDAPLSPLSPLYDTRVFEAQFSISTRSTDLAESTIAEVVAFENATEEAPVVPPKQRGDRRKSTGTTTRVPRAPQDETSFHLATPRLVTKKAKGRTLSSEIPVGVPMEEPVEAPVEEPVATPVEEPVIEEPVKALSAEPAEALADEPVEASVDVSVNAVEDAAVSAGASVATMSPVARRVTRSARRQTLGHALAKPSDKTTLESDARFHLATPRVRKGRKIQAKDDLPSAPLKEDDVPEPVAAEAVAAAVATEAVATEAVATEAEEKEDAPKITEAEQPARVLRSRRKTTGGVEKIQPENKLLENDASFHIATPRIRRQVPRSKTHSEEPVAAPVAESVQQADVPVQLKEVIPQNTPRTRSSSRVSLAPRPAIATPVPALLPTTAFPLPSPSLNQTRQALVAGAIVSPSLGQFSVPMPRSSRSSRRVPIEEPKESAFKQPYPGTPRPPRQLSLGRLSETMEPQSPVSKSQRHELAQTAEQVNATSTPEEAASVAAPASPENTRLPSTPKSARKITTPKLETPKAEIRKEMSPVKVLTPVVTSKISTPKVPTPEISKVTCELVEMPKPDNHVLEKLETVMVDSTEKIVNVKRGRGLNVEDPKLQRRREALAETKAKAAEVKRKRQKIANAKPKGIRKALNTPTRTAIRSFQPSQLRNPKSRFPVLPEELKADLVSGKVTLRHPPTPVRVVITAASSVKPIVEDIESRPKTRKSTRRPLEPTEVTEVTSKRTRRQTKSVMEESTSDSAHKSEEDAISMTTSRPRTRTQFAVQATSTVETEELVSEMISVEDDENLVAREDTLPKSRGRKPKKAKEPVPLPEVVPRVTRSAVRKAK